MPAGGSYLSGLTTGQINESCTPMFNLYGFGILSGAAYIAADGSFSLSNPVYPTTVNSSAGIGHLSRDGPLPRPDNVYRDAPIVVGTRELYGPARYLVVFVDEKTNPPIAVLCKVSSYVRRGETARPAESGEGRPSPARGERCAAPQG